METDKIAHLTVGTGFYLGMYFLFGLQTAVISVCILAILKEVNDFTRLIPKLTTSKHKKFEFWDMVATIIIPLIITSIILI